VVDAGSGHLLTARVAAGRLGVSTAIVYKLVAKGDLPHIRVSNAIRVTPGDLDTFLVRYRGQASGRKGSPRPSDRSRPGLTAPGGTHRW
jgi:excisionase family DNA binding protein